MVQYLYCIIKIERNHGNEPFLNLPIFIRLVTLVTMMLVSLYINTIGLLIGIIFPAIFSFLCCHGNGVAICFSSKNYFYLYFISMTTTNFFGSSKKNPKFHVVLVHYGIFMKELEKFQSLSWQHVVIDELDALDKNVSDIVKDLNVTSNKITVLCEPLKAQRSEVYNVLNLLDPLSFR